MVQFKDYTPPPKPNAFVDAGKSLVSGVGKGVSGIMSFPEEAPNLLLKGANFLGKKVGLLDQGSQAPQINIPIIPSFQQAEEMRMKTPGMRYEPQTRAGEYASTIGEYMAPGGLFGKAPLVVGGIAGTAQETSKSLGAGEGVATGVGIGVDVVGNILLALKNPAHLVKLKETVKNLQKTDIDKANELIAEGKKYGIDLSAPEAIAQATGDKTALQVMDAVGQTDYGSTVIGQFTKDRFSQVSDANLKWLNDNFPNIDPKNIDVTKVSNDFVETLVKGQEDVVKNINQQARTLKEGGWAKFDQGTDLSNSVNSYLGNLKELIKGKKISGEQRSFYNEIINKFPPQGTIDNTYAQKAYDDLVETAKSLRNEGKGTQALAYDNEAKKLLNILNSNEYYKNASDFTKKMYEKLNPTLDALSVNNQIVKGVNPTFTLLKNTMYSDNISPVNIIRLQKEMSKLDGGSELFEEMVGLLFTKRIQKSIPAKETENVGAKVLEAFMGKGNDKLTLQYIKSVATAQGKDPELAVKGFEKYMNVLEATSRLPKGNSATFSRTEFQKSLNDLGFFDISINDLNILDKIMPGLRTLVKNNRSKDLSKMFFGENAIDEMIKISNASNTKVIKSMISVSNNTVRDVAEATQTQNEKTKNQNNYETLNLKDIE